jgi:hypothetical protein
MAVLKKLLSTKRTKLVQLRVETRFRHNKCLSQMESDDGDILDCDNPRGARVGLCDRCYSRHNSVMKSFGDDYQAAAEHEAQMIREGLILREGESRELSNRSLLRRRRA